MIQALAAVLAMPLLLAGMSAHAQQSYPNISGEVLLDDERVIVQRFRLEPGEWEGIHEHPEHQLVIVLQSSDELTQRFGETETVISNIDRHRPQSMSVFWRPGPVALSERHETGNTGTRALEWIAITFKSDSIATEAPAARQPADHGSTEP